MSEHRVHWESVTALSCEILRRKTKNILDCYFPIHPLETLIAVLPREQNSKRALLVPVC